MLDMPAPNAPVRTATRLASDLQAIFGPRLRAVVVYGAHARPHTRPVNARIQTCALVDAITYADLSACAERARGWEGQGLEMPLLLPTREFERSLDVFPLEYGDLIDHHVPVFGDDPFEGHDVGGEDLRRACEVQARGHVIHLREGFLLAGHDAAAIARLLTASAGPFAALMDAFTRVTQGPRPATPEMLAAHAAHVAGLPATLVQRLLEIEEDDALEPAEATRLYPPYIDLMHDIVAFVDTWRPETASQATPGDV
jgi:hypothetical protein